MKEKTYWGHHLIINASGCEHSTITDYYTIHRFTKDLVKDIDMVAYGEPQIIHFGEGDKEGFTLVQLIETSNICAHFANDKKTIYLDVFSCKPYDKDVVADLMMEYFHPNFFNESFRERE
jgi:S-adenosylmethionine/arginine decarboxylase-like enzyme